MKVTIHNLFLLLKKKSERVVLARMVLLYRIW